jgi:Flp pilus assembly protein TadB
MATMVLAMVVVAVLLPVLVMVAATVAAVDVVFLVLGQRADHRGARHGSERTSSVAWPSGNRSLLQPR